MDKVDLEYQEKRQIQLNIDEPVDFINMVDNNQESVEDSNMNISI